ncbi:complex I subunit 5 family protein [Anaeromyxobacter diazotrophicus]|uniref:NADH:quinone oxidoreductase/Mrp antiporter transmembrane domain-containing protein n=1 Tax=Anaeromyxobacter diazotrophicus TaxID=2590199 RepID=A0A7I9VG84_9BACT|nr:proton-conducting transporter membrane subunit [Anaeromyxobacter diazotrophicus]GEJ55393.1 hypothetical protein AMYX_01340 [Anaeromyxobacter diazotrophicus]
MERLAPLAVVLPVLAAALLAAVGRHLPRWARDAVALLALLAAGALAAACAWRGREDLVVSWLGGWRPRGGIAVGVALAVDPVGGGLAALSCGLGAAALVFSFRYFDSAEGHFHVLLLVFVAALTGFGLTGDLFNLFVFFELMSVSAYALAGYKTEEPAVVQGALHFAVVNTLGATLVLFGLSLLYGATGALSLAQLTVAVPGAPRPVTLLAFALLATGFLVKGAAVPFHFWLADAHAVAPTPACVLFSGVMVEAGLYAVMRLAATAFHGLLPPGGHALGAALLGLGLLTAWVGAALAFAQRHLKRLLAFSTVSHGGLLLAALSLATPGGYAAAAVYALGHGLVKGALFLGAGMVLHRLRSVDEVALRGRGRRLAVPAVVLGAGGLALAGAPPFALFRGDALLDEALRASGHQALAWLFTLAAAVTGAAVLRAALRIFAGLGPREPDAPETGGETSEAPETRPSRERIPLTMSLPALLLLGFGLAAGLWPGLGEGARAAGARFADGPGYAARVLQGTPLPPVSRTLEAPLGPAAARGGAFAAGALALALAVLLRRRLPERLRAAVAAAWGPAIRALRQLHGGRIGESVAWLALGAAAISAAALALG